MTRYILMDFETSGLDASIDNILAVCYYDSDVMGVVHVVRGIEERIIKYLFGGPWEAMLSAPQWPDLDVFSYNGLKFDLPFLMFRVYEDTGARDTWEFFSRRLMRFHLDLKQFARLESGEWGSCALHHVVPEYAGPGWSQVTGPPWVGKFWSEISKELWNEMAQYQFEEMRAFIKYIRQCQAKYQALHFPTLIVDPDALRLRTVDFFGEKEG